MADAVHRTVTHGQLVGDATEPGPFGYVVSMKCSCGGSFLRRVTPHAAEQDLLALGAADAG